MGGWHDAGDYDLRVESQAGEAYILAMACENFGTYWDETSIDFEKEDSRDSPAGWKRMTCCSRWKTVL